MAPGSVHKIELIHNGKLIERPVVEHHEIELALNNDTKKHTISVSYIAYGSKYYSHFTPEGVFLNKFEVDLEIYDCPYIIRTTSYCMYPNNYESIGNKTVIKWHKEDSVLAEYIDIRFVEEKEIKQEDNGVSGTVVLLVTVLAIIAVLLAAFFIWCRSYCKIRKNKIQECKQTKKGICKKKNEPEKIEIEIIKTKGD